jgi:hypothetical protein
VALPAVPLDRYLGAKRLTFGRETFELRGATREDVQLGAIVTIKEYSAPLMLAKRVAPHALELARRSVRAFRTASSACRTSCGSPRASGSFRASGR